MKKLITMLLAVTFVFALSACGEDDTQSSSMMQGGKDENYMSESGTGVSSFISGVESRISSMTSMLTSGDTTISADDALKIALKDAGVTKDSISDYESELERQLGILVYDIEFKSGNKEYSYEIHAENGSIVDRDIDKDID